MRKPWYTSKTIWFNIAAAMGAALEASLSIIQGELKPEYYLILVVFVAGGNVILRMLSTQGIGK
jgi:hypothetical protein